MLLRVRLLDVLRVHLFKVLLFVAGRGLCGVLTVQVFPVGRGLTGVGGQLLDVCLAGLERDEDKWQFPVNQSADQRQEVLLMSGTRYKLWFNFTGDWYCWCPRQIDKIIINIYSSSWSFVLLCQLSGRDLIKYPLFSRTLLQVRRRNNRSKSEPQGIYFSHVWYLDLF